MMFKNKPISFYIFSLVIILFCPTIACAEMYKWINENGQVHYGDRPPESEKSEAKWMRLEKGNRTISLEAEILQSKAFDTTSRIRKMDMLRNAEPKVRLKTKSKMESLLSPEIQQALTSRGIAIPPLPETKEEVDAYKKYIETKIKEINNREHQR